MSRHQKQIDFMGKRKLFFALSITVTVIGLIAVLLEPLGRLADPTFTAPVGINWGIDFSPGTVIQVGYDKKPDIDQINQTVSDFSKQTGVKFRQAQAVSVAGSEGPRHRVSLRLGFMKKQQSDKLMKELEEATGEFQILQKDSVGPIVGKSLMKKALYAVFWASLLIFFYVWWKFEPAFSIGALAALAHDVFVMLTGMALFRFEVNSPFVAAMLVVIGYSVNDTIVIFDRIRENARHMRRVSAEEVFNTSVNQVLGRSITTVGTVVIVLVTITLFGGASLRDFSGSLLVGVATGAYSSICIASAIALGLGRHKRYGGKISHQLVFGVAKPKTPHAGAEGSSEGLTDAEIAAGLDKSVNPRELPQSAAGQPPRHRRR